MEIERKFLIKQMPVGYEAFPCRHIEQAYLCTRPVVRVRRQDEEYYLTYKGEGLLSREEYNLSLDQQAYYHLLDKADGRILTKTRYLLPAEGYGSLVIELDVFEGAYQGLMLAEVEFSSEEEAMAFIPPEWFGDDVTFSGEYQNSRLACGNGGIGAASQQFPL